MMPAQNDDEETPLLSSAPPFTIPLPIPPNPEIFTYQLSTSFPPLSVFDSQFIHPALIIPAKRTAELRRSLTHILMHQPKKKDVYPVTTDEGDPKTERKLALKIPPEGADIYKDPILEPLLLQSSPWSSSSSPAAALRRSTHTRHQSYSDLTVEQTLRLILPPPNDLKTPIPTSFEIAGHIAHLNLTPPLLPYRHIIGKVILDKNKPRIKTVVNKLGNIANEYRTFEMELLADSEERWEVEVKEEGCRFKLNFREVYWNSRLQFEHKRLVKLIAGKKRQNRQQKKTLTKKNRGNDDDDDDDDDDIVSSSSSSAVPQSPLPHPQHLVVIDVMAGVGPFAIPLASHYSHITVHANDLNPRSYHYLNTNAKLNRCSNNSDNKKQKLYTYNTDGRLFIRQLERRNVIYDAVIMNLPAIAVEFLDVFRGWRNPSKDDHRRRPVIYVYCFTPKDDDEGRDAIKRCETALGCPLDVAKHEVSVHIVRDVSPNKNMVCVSFRLPKVVESLERIKVKGDNEEEEEKEEEEKGKEEMMVCKSDIGCEGMGDGQLQKKARME